MAVPIPAPLPSDSEKVVNLLQNAALFGRIGDTEEALHWLRQAAECAGDSGDDVRTLALARCAAELDRVLAPGTDTSSDGGSGVHERRLPAPPPRARDEAAFLLKRTAPPSKPPAKALDPADVKALDPAEVMALDPAEKVLEPKASEETSAESRPPDSRSTLTPPPLPSGRANGSRPPLASTLRPPTSSRPGPPSMRSRTTAAPASRPSPVSTRAPAAVSRASFAPAPSTRSKPVPQPVAPAVVLPSLRQAARVSVERSSSEPGLFLVRLLEEGNAPQSGCTEALLVSTDPNARPFAV